MGYPSKFDSKNPYAHVENGYYDINGKSIYFRSKREANYALFLDYMKLKTGDPVEWWYEKDTFLFDKIMYGVRSYKMDFTLLRKFDKYEYHEIKGYMDSKSRTKLRRMKIYYPDKKVVLIDNEGWKAIAKWGRLLKFY